MLEYNTLVYVPNEDYSYFRVMIFRPDKNGYLLENCDPRFCFKPFYKMVYLDQVNEKIISDISKMKEFWGIKINELVKENKALEQKKYNPDEVIKAKISDIQKDIDTVKEKLASITDEDIISQKQRAIRQMEKGIRRLKGKDHVKYLKFYDEIDNKIRANESKIRKYKEDRDNLESLLSPIDKSDIYIKDTLQRKIFGNSVR